jgi:hypothetical protein
VNEETGKAASISSGIPEGAFISLFDLKISYRLDTPFEGIPAL